MPACGPLMYCKPEAEYSWPFQFLWLVTK